MYTPRYIFAVCLPNNMQTSYDREKQKRIEKTQRHAKPTPVHLPSNTKSNTNAKSDSVLSPSLPTRPVCREPQPASEEVPAVRPECHGHVRDAMAVL